MTKEETANSEGKEKYRHLLDPVVFQTTMKSIERRAGKAQI